jgi:mono/diheme cytochrome c family protein
MIVIALIYHCKRREAERRTGRTRAGLGCGDRTITWVCKAERVRSIAVLGLLVLLFSGCNVERRKSDAELGLNAEQAAGRKIYDNNCDRCHEPYSTRGKKGPGLKGMFQNKYLSVSGLPANDERVTDIIRLGRKEMPGYAQTLSQQDIDELLAYLHTL